MYKEFKIKNFRCFEDFRDKPKKDNLYRHNNGGKIRPSKSDLSIRRIRSRIFDPQMIFRELKP